MQDKQKELFKSRIERLREENDELKDKLASVKKENADILKSLSRSETLLNSMPVGLILVQDRRVLRINNAFLDYLGYRPEDIMDTEFTDLVHVDERDHTEKIHRLWESGRMSPDHYETRLVPSSGLPEFFEIRCRRIRFYNRTAFLLIAIGIRERQELEKEKIQKEKIRALLTMAAGVKDYLGPFTDIILETMRECRTFDHSGNTNFDRIYKRLEETSVKALTLNEALEIIAGTAKDKQIHAFLSLNETVKAVVDSMQRRCIELAERRGVKIALKSYLRSSSLIEGDFKNITHAISHLIANAMDAMPDGGEIHITTEDNNGDSHVYVQDNGNGIPDMLKDRIFDPFFTTKKGSMGLGLNISSSIIKRHGGAIEFTSREGEGATFHIRLPVSGQTPASKAEGRRRRLTGARIMIIQENDVAREVLSHTLKARGCRVLKTLNAAEGLVKLKNRPFDMLIIDDAALNMERGVFIKKARKAVPGLSVALITSKAGSGIDSRQGAKPDLNIIKPVDVNSAVKRISELLSVKKQTPA